MVRNLIFVLAALQAGCASQTVVVPERNAAADTAVDVAWSKGRFTLDSEGYGFFTSADWGTRYRISDEQFTREFGPSLQAMQSVLDAGLPELPHSYVALMPHPSGPLGALVFSGGQGEVQLSAAQTAAYIDGYPGAPAVDVKRIQQDFGPALSALHEAQKAQRSYLMLMESPDGEQSKVVFRSRAGEALLDVVGATLTLDGLPYEADAQLADQDFAVPRAATSEILAAGLPKLPHSFVAFGDVQQPAVGEIEVLDGPAKGARLQAAGQAVLIDGFSNKIFMLDQADFTRVFAGALEAAPRPPETFVLYFDSGSAQLGADARALMPLIFDEIKRRPLPEVSIVGHTDTVSDGTQNERLSRLRGESVAQLLRKGKVTPHDLTIEAYGETQLAVATRDNQPEKMNRRVEVTIR